jgi:hypothetical protein
VRRIFPRSFTPVGLEEFHADWRRNRCRLADFAKRSIIFVDFEHYYVIAILIACQQKMSIGTDSEIAWNIAMSGLLPSGAQFTSAGIYAKNSDTV